MMTKAEFLKVAPKTRAEFVARFRADYVFRQHAENLGISVIGESVLLPNGKVVSARVR